jgi:hypothetical protein
MRTPQHLARLFGTLVLEPSGSLKITDSLFTSTSDRELQRIVGFPLILNLNTMALIGRLTPNQDCSSCLQTHDKPLALPLISNGVSTCHVQ